MRHVVAALVGVGVWVCAPVGCESPVGAPSDGLDASIETETSEAGGEAPYDDVDDDEDNCKCGLPCSTDDDCDDDDPCTVDTCGNDWGAHCAHRGVTCDPGFDCDAVTGACVLTCELGATVPCDRRNAFGTCSGVRACEPTGLTDCDAPEPATETCDALDNDCDGQTDEDLTFGDACETTNAFGTCAGVTACQAGAVVCAGPVPAKEECNALDDNCDGQTDEGFPDANQNGVPDCLDCDDDYDGVGSEDCGSGDGPLDNCPGVPNPDQANWDLENLGPIRGDNQGDACDPDDDNDGVNDDVDCQPKNFEVHPGAPETCDGQDNDCDTIVDENFSNADGDALADCVDPDQDNDGLLNELDNCPLVWNPDQADDDGDGVGDPCE